MYKEDREVEDNPRPPFGSEGKKGKKNKGNGHDPEEFFNASREYEGSGDDQQDRENNYDPAFFRPDKDTDELIRVSGRKDKKLPKFPVDVTPTEGEGKNEKATVFPADATPTKGRK